MRPDNFDVQRIIDHLQGTCGLPISDAMGENGILDFEFKPVYPDMTEDDLNGSDQDTIDQQIFICEECGWWCERSEESEENPGYCEDCRPDDGY